MRLSLCVFALLILAFVPCTWVVGAPAAQDDKRIIDQAEKDIAGIQEKLKGAGLPDDVRKKLVEKLAIAENRRDKYLTLKMLRGNTSPEAKQLRELQLNIDRVEVVLASPNVTAKQLERIRKSLKAARALRRKYLKNMGAFAPPKRARSTDVPDGPGQEGEDPIDKGRTEQQKVPKVEWAGEDDQPGLPVDPKLFAAYANSLVAFDRLYWQRQNHKKVTPEEWVKMADRIHKHTKKGLLPKGRPDSGRFRLRALLVEGECRLFASMEFLVLKKKDAAREQWEKGCVLLHEVVLGAKPANDFLPRYATYSVEEGDGLVLHPLAGLGMIGTGLNEGIMRRHTRGGRMKRAVAWQRPDPDSLDPIDPKYRFDKLEVIYKELGDLSLSPGNVSWKRFLKGKESPKESSYWNDMEYVHTSEKAKELLKDFCPWGVPMYQLLKHHGLTKDLDMTILRPFGGDKITLACRFEIKTIPVHIRRFMEKVEGKGPEGGMGALKVYGRNFNVDWEVCTKPAYSIYYVSPTVYDWTAKDFGYWVATAGKWYFLGWKLALVDVALWAGTSLYDYVYDGTDADSPLYFTTRTITVGNDAGILTNSYLVDKDKLDPKGIVFELIKYAFVAAGDFEIKWFLDSVDPDLSLMGEGYDGSGVPPVFIRADIYGTLKVPETFYAKALRVSTYHQLDTGEVANRPDGDLEDDPKQKLVLAGRFRDIDSPLQKKFWPRLPNKRSKPLGLRLQFIDMTPKAQLIHLKFDPATLKQWRAPAAVGEPKPKLEAWLYGPPGADEPSVRVSLQSLRYKDKLTLKVHNKQDQETAGDTHTDPWIMPEGDVLPCPVLAPLHCHYSIRVMRNGKLVREIPVNFVAKKGKARTGKVLVSRSGVVNLHQRVAAMPEERVQEVLGDPKAVLPPLLRVLAPKEGEAVKVEMVSVYANLTGAPVGKYDLQATVGDKTWHLYGEVKRPYDAVIFVGRVPVRKGTNNLRFSVKGAPDVTRKVTCSIPALFGGTGPSEQNLKYHQICEQNYKNAATPEEKEKAREQLVGSYYTIATGWSTVDREKARSALLLGSRLLPEPPDAGTDKYHRHRERIWHMLALCQYQLHNLEGLKKADYEYLNAWLSVLADKQAGSQPYKTVAKRIGDHCSSALNRWISAGGSADVAEYWWKNHVKYMKQAGVTIAPELAPAWRATK